MEGNVIGILIGIVKTTPMVALILGMWWFTRKDYKDQLKDKTDHIIRLEERMKDSTDGLHKVAVALEGIRERLR